LALPRAPPASTARRAATCSLGVGARVAGVAAAAALLVAAAPAAGALSEREVLVFDHDQGLVGADFRGRKDLVGAIFSKSNCKGADFSGADLHNAQLDDAVLIEAKMDGANCENVLATKAKLQKASLRGVNFTNANLISAVFGAGTDVEGAGTLSGLAGKLRTVLLSRHCRSGWRQRGWERVGDCRVHCVLTSVVSWRLASCFWYSGCLADFTGALIEAAVQKKLCLTASGTNPATGVDTREFLMCAD
jgi:uncharacterized protein YjbI with pentapeptide repeats